MQRHLRLPPIVRGQRLLIFRELRKTNGGKSDEAFCFKNKIAQGAKGIGHNESLSAYAR
jgi:hypothetical protein